MITNDIITKSVDNVVTVVPSVTDSSDIAAVTSSSSSSTEREQIPVVSRSTHSQSIQEPLSTQPGHHTHGDVFTQEELFKNTGMNITFLHSRLIRCSCTCTLYLHIQYVHVYILTLYMLFSFI